MNIDYKAATNHWKMRNIIILAKQNICLLVLSLDYV